MQVVNGVPCFNCTDVEKAKKVDTAPRQDQAQNVAAAVAAPERSFATPNQPLGGVGRGAQVNLNT